MRKEFGDGEGVWGGGVVIEEDEGVGGGELVDDLAADTAGGAVGEGVVEVVGDSDGDGVDFAEAEGDGVVDGGAFGADRGAVGGILDIGAGVHGGRRVVGHDKSGTDRKVGIRGVGVLCSGAGGLDQLVVSGHGHLLGL